MTDLKTISPAEGRSAPSFLLEAEFIELIGKRPKAKNWTTDRSVRFGIADALDRLAEGRNVGVVLGERDLVLDIDPRNYRDGLDSFERLKADLCEDFGRYPAVRTGSGGWHIYMRLPDDTGRLRGDLGCDGYPGIELKFVGRQVVAPGSHGETGQRYVVERDLDPLEDDLGIPLAPPSLLQLAVRPASASMDAPPGSMSPERLATLLDALPVEIYRGDHDKWLALMMACHDATGGVARDEFVQWSASDPEYADREAEIASRWDSLGGRAAGRVTERTLLKHLVDAGVAHLVEPDHTQAVDDFEGIEEVAVEDAISPVEAKKQQRLHRQNALPRSVKEINQQGYIAVHDEGGFRIYREVWDYELDRTYWEVQKKQDFVDNLAGYSVQGETPQGRETKVPVAAAWLKWPGRERRTAVKFDPANRIPASAQVLNLWTGWSVKPVAGDWSLMKKLLLEALCDGNRELYEYVLDWSAFMIQHPDKPAEAAIFFVGEKGTGKGTYCRALCDLAGRHGIQVASPSHFGGHFNAHMRDCIFMFADEALWAGDKKVEGQIKAFITEPTILIEGKGKDAVVCRNYLHVMGASNNPWVWQATEDERRLVTNRVNAKFKGDHAFFGALNDQMRNGGLEAMLHELQTRDISEFHPRRCQPKTDELRRQIDLSKPRVIQYLEALRTEAIGPFAPGRELVALHEDVYRLSEVQKSIAKIGQAQVQRQVEEWLKDLGAKVHDRCTTRGKASHPRPTERLWSLANHDVYAAMTPIKRADTYLEQLFADE